MKKIALFTNGDKNYYTKARRCFEIFDKFNPGVFDFYYVTSDTEAKPSGKMNVIILNTDDYIQGFTDTGYAPESFLYYPAPNILYEKGYKYSMCVDADTVCFKKLDFSWIEEDFVYAGAKRLRNNLADEIDAWYFLKCVTSPDTIDFLENTFELQNKNNIIEIMDAVLFFNNENWVKRKMYEKAYSLFKKCKDEGFPMRDSDILSALLIIDTPKSYWKHLHPEWNWYYEDPTCTSNGGENVNILHSLAVKPWDITTQHRNRVLHKGKEIWNNIPWE